jgi:hypothetical protein
MLEHALVWLAGGSLLAFSGIAFVLLAAVCGIGIQIGDRRIRRRAKGERGHEREGVATIVQGMVGLVTFTLALSIGYAQDRAETRRDLVVTEANAIGAAWLRTKTVAGEEGPAIAKLIEELAKVELAFTIATSTEPEAALNARRSALQDQIWTLAQIVARRDPNDITSNLISALNDMFNAELALRFTFDSRLPLNLSLMLLSGALLAVGAMGYHFGLTEARHPVLVSLLLVMLTGGIAFFLDVNRPRIGMTHVNPAPLVWTIEAFAAPSPPH